MSEAVRNYTGHAGSLRTGPRRRRGRGFISRFTLLLVAFLAIAFWWITRDSYEFTECIPRGQRFTVVLDEPLPARERILQSRVWQALPASWLGPARPGLLSVDLGIPEWVLNNVFYKRAFLTGNEFGKSSDVVILTRMTRIGALLERFHALLSAVEDDYAGGLRLRALRDEGLYYAVRGRILLVSSSRTALIRSLTLAEGDRLETDKFGDLAQAGNEDIRGTLALAEDQPFGDVFESVAFAVRIDRGSAQAKCRGTLRTEAAGRFAPLLRGVRPSTLQAPPSGMVALSANFGKPVREVWNGLGEVTGVPWLSEAQWQTWEEGVPGQTPGVVQFMTILMGKQGPGIRLAVAGVDVNEFVPLPVLVGTVDGNAKVIAQQLEAIPPPPDGVKPWEAYPRYDAEKGLVHVPLIGGPSLEPAAAIDRGALAFSSSRTALETLLAANAPGDDLPQPGNLYVQIRPAPLVDAIVESGRLLAEFDGLRGFTKDSFEAAAAEWTASAAIVSEITAVAAVQDGTVDLELGILCDNGIAAEADG